MKAYMTIPKSTVVYIGGSPYATEEVLVFEIPHDTKAFLHAEEDLDKFLTEFLNVFQ